MSLKSSCRLLAVSRQWQSPAQVRTAGREYFNFGHSRRFYASLPQIELTSKRFKVTRGSYGIINDSDIQFFESILGKSRVLTDPSDLEGANVDWMQMVRGASKVLLKPKSTQEVSALMRYCNEKKLAVCPQGGNTSQSGGSVPVFDEIILSTAQLNKIISLDEWSGAMVCEAGCILETLNDYLMERGFIMPLDLGAKGNCHVGGNVATNAGGLRVVRYGGLHSSVLGVEAVLANGTVMDCLSLMKKDNTGYDLKHLFIGSEGTLGIVTKVAIHCPVRPNATKLAYLGLDSFQNVLKTFKNARGSLAEILSSCEYMDAESIDCVVDNLNLKNPLDGSHPYYMIIETCGSNESHDGEKLEKFLETSMADGTVVDGTVAADSNQSKAIWALRERIPEALQVDGFYYSYDLSVPLTTFEELVETTRQQLVGPGCESLVRVVGFGHLGDNNIHLMISAKGYNTQLLKKIEPFVYDWTRNQRGSVSAEHGLGFKKKDFITFSKSLAAIDMMRQMKKIFDPNNILNPYKVLPDSATPLSSSSSTGGDKKIKKSMTKFFESS